MGSHRLQWNAPLLSGVLAAAVLTVLGWPVLWQPSSWVLGGGGGDFPSIAWGLWRVSSSLPVLPLHHPDIFYPQGATLMIADLPGAVILSPLTTAAGPVSAFNALQALHVILAAAAGSALCRSAGLAGASVGGLSLALSPVLLSSLHNGNPDVTPVFWIPLAALAAHRIREGWGWSLLAGLAVGVSAWFSPYVGAMSALAALAMAPWRSPRALLAGAVAASVAGLFVLLVQQSLLDGGAMVAKPPVNVAAPSPGAADVAGWLWPSTRAQPDGWSQHAWFPGVTVLFLAAWGWRAGARWWILVATGVLLSLGPVLQLAPGHAASVGGWPVALPGRWLQQLPGLSALHIQYRFAALAMVGLGVLASAGVTRLPRRAQWVALAAVLIELGTWGAPLVAAGPAPDSASCALLSGLPPGAVLDLPAEREERRLLAQSCHGRPVAEGINQPYPGIVHQALRGGLSELSRLGFRYVVIHEDVSAMTPPPAQVAAAALRAEASRRGMVVAEDGGVTVVDLEAR